MSISTAFENTQDIDINEDFKRAIDMIGSGKRSVFITGSAGTGKSTFLDFCRKNIKKKMVVLAPTGVAAVNVRGQTIHSFFHFKPDITVQRVSSIKINSQTAKIFKKLETIIIDEVSMARADLIDCIDTFLQLYGPDTTKPFGGVQMIFIGDLYQLAPVVPASEREIFKTFYKSPFFFDAHVIKKVGLEVLEFKKNYRQRDEKFLNLLHAIRKKKVSLSQMEQLNTRYFPDFVPEQDAFYVYLTTTNALAEKINVECLDALREDLFTHEGKLQGDFKTQHLPTHQALDLKIGARVMLLNNDPENRWVNGSIGQVIDIFNAGFNAMAVVIQFDDGQKVEVEPFKWEIFEFFYNEKKDRIDSRVVGMFRQFPLKLAWAITIHKSQGKTFDHLILDVGRGAFCHGQIYVALSRCTTFEGIVLKRKISLRDIQTRV